MAPARKRSHSQALAFSSAARLLRALDFPRPLFGRDSVSAKRLYSHRSIRSREKGSLSREVVLEVVEGSMLVLSVALDEVARSAKAAAVGAVDSVVGTFVVVLGLLAESESVAFAGCSRVVVGRRSYLWACS